MEESFSCKNKQLEFVYVTVAWEAMFTQYSILDAPSVGRGDIVVTHI